MVMWELVLKTMVAGGQRDVVEPTADILNKGVLEAVKYPNLPQMRPSHLLFSSFSQHLSSFSCRNELLLHLKTYNIYYEGQNLQLRHREVRNWGQHQAGVYLWQERLNGEMRMSGLIRICKVQELHVNNIP